MADLARIKNNVRKMVDQGAPEQDIDAYIAQEGVTLEDVRNAGTVRTPDEIWAKGKVPGNVPEFDPGVEGYDPKTGEVNNNSGVSGNIGAGLSGFVEGLPVVGPTLETGTEYAAAGLSQAAGIGGGKSLGEIQQEIHARQNETERQNPNFHMGGYIGGQVAGSLAVGGGTAAGLGKLGSFGSNVGTRIVAGMGENLGLTAADMAARDQEMTGTDVALATLVPFGGEVLGRGLAKGYRATRDYLRPFTASGSKMAAVDRIAAPLAEDIASGTAQTEQYLNDAAARGAPVIAADMGGQQTQALVKKASGFGDLAAETSERFKTQGDRVKAGWNKLTGATDLDDLDVRSGLEDLAKTSRKPLYDAAYNHPGAQRIWNSQLAQLSKGPGFKRALRDAVEEGQNVASRLSGAPAIRHPFRLNAQTGALELADPNIVPNLAFWDIVQRQLRKQAELTKTPTLNGVRNDLNQILDDATKDAAGNSLFKEARTHAAKIFGAEDLYEAGLKAARDNASWSDIKRGFSKLTPEERKLFMAGHAKAEYNKITASGKETKDLSKLYTDDNFNAKIEGMYGKSLADEFKVNIGIERVMQATNKATGNGSASVLRDLGTLLATGTSIGVGSGALTYYNTGDWKKAVTSALVLGGGRYAFQKMDQKNKARLFKEVADLLSSRDPAVRAQLVEAAKTRGDYREVIEFFGDVMSRVAGGAVRSEQTGYGDRGHGGTEPLRITVGGNQ